MTEASYVCSTYGATSLCEESVRRTAELGAAAAPLSAMETAE